MTFDPFLQATQNPWLQGLGYGGTQSPYGGGQQSPFGNLLGFGGLQNVLGQTGSPWTQHLFSQLSPQTWMGGQPFGQSPFVGGQQFGSPYGQQFGTPYGQISPLALLLPQILQQAGSQFGGGQQYGSPYGQISPLTLLLPQLLQQGGQQSPFGGGQQYGQISPLATLIPQLLQQHTGYGQIPPHVLSAVVPQVLAQIAQNPILASSLLRSNPLLGGMHGGYPFI